MSRVAHEAASGEPLELDRRALLRGGATTALAALAGCSAPLALRTRDRDWPQYRHDAARTGFAPEVTGPSGDVARQWTTATEARTVGQPAVVGDEVFVNADGVAALDRTTGERRWTVPVFYRTGSPVAVASDAVYAASRFALRALGTADGAERWTLTMGDRELHAPAVADGGLYVVSSGRGATFDARVHALSRDGTERWRTPVGENRLPAFVAAVANGTVFVGTERLFALDAEDGTVLWSADPGGTVGVPAVADGRVVVGTRQAGNVGAVVAYDAADGTELWRFGTGLSATSLALADDAVYVTSDAVSALDVTDGTERWRLESNSYVLADPTVGADRVYLAGLLGSVRALDRTDGSDAWVVETDATLPSSPAVTEDLVVVGGDRRVLAVA